MISNFQSWLKERIKDHSTITLEEVWEAAVEHKKKEECCHHYPLGWNSSCNEAYCTNCGKFGSEILKERK